MSYTTVSIKSAILYYFRHTIVLESKTLVLIVYSKITMLFILSFFKASRTMHPPGQSIVAFRPNKARSNESNSILVIELIYTLIKYLFCNVEMIKSISKLIKSEFLKNYIINKTLDNLLNNIS